MNEARKRILIWVMTLVFAVTSVVGTSTVLVNAESATGPYGWTVSYADPQNDGETVKVNITFNHINKASVEIPCRLYDEDIWDSIVIAGYDKYGNYTEMDVNIDDDGCGIDGEAYMEDSEGFNSCFNVYVNKMYHEYEVINAVEATCKDYGYNEFKCSGCGDVFRQVDTGYLDYHKWGKYVVTKKATYFTAGKKTQYCKVCNVPNKESIVTIPKKVLAKPFVFGASITPDLSKSSGYDDLRVSWEKVSGATGYQIQYRLKGNSTWQKYNKGNIVKGTKIYLKNMKDGKWYQVRVRACVKSGDKTAYSNWYQVLSTMTLAKVKITSIKKSGNYVTVKWKGIPTSGEDGYELYRATSKNGKYKKVAEVCQKSKSYPSVKISHKKGKTYYYKVKAFSRWDGDHKLYGPWSDKVKCKR